MKHTLLLLVSAFVLINFNVRADERLLVNETFDGWSVTSSATETTVNKTTQFTNETLVYKLCEVESQPAGIDRSKFNWNLVSEGCLMAAKTATPYIELSPLASITKVEFIHAATGGSRGYQLWKKSATDADWVSVSNSYANPAQGVLVTVNINEANVALKFTNLNSGQNAYLFDLRIYGNYESATQQVTLATSVNIEGAGSITRSIVSESYDLGTQLALTANRNFGYAFSHWANAAGTQLSTDNPLNITLNSDTAITAVFTAINTYELKINVEGGARDYMVTLAPAPTVIDNKKMYEDGTLVTLVAENRPILLFTNWASGETTPQLSVNMTANREVTAVYAVQDYLAGWDFHYTGSGSRSADFYSTAENQAATLVLRNAAGATQSWLDKSTVAAGGYEGRPAAVNWKNFSDRYYYQLSFNAADFQNLSIRSAMLYNYNAYSVQKLEYSLNGTDFTSIGSFTMTSPKVWYDDTFTLPADANNAPVVYIRWIPDYTSDVVGTESTNDGTSLAGIYIFGSEAIINDGTPPVLLSSVPADNAPNVSANGKIVLTFDEKIKVAEGTTGRIEMTENHPATVLPEYEQNITPVVSGKTLTFSYSGLAYNTEYDFNLPANTVSDLGDNVLNQPITIHFTTINRPAVTKRNFDFVVGRDGDFAAAIAAANAAQAGGQRFYIFFPDGEYNIGEQTGDANQMTTITAGNLSLVGQSADNTVIYNRSTQEAIGTTATIWFSNKQSGNNYLQDLSILNKADYRTGTLTGRHVALRDQSKKAIYKNVKLLSNQDTYYTGDDRSYWENGEIHGTVDFICGGGDIFFNQTLLYLEERANNCLTAPATSGAWGYVFSDCTIDGFEINKNGYRLGRSWQNAPKAVYLNTTMKVLPAAGGWGDPMNVVPAVFAEYNSVSANGTPLDLSTRRTSYTLNNNTVTLNPILSAAQAANYTVENVLGGTDQWQPQLYTEQAAAPIISLTDSNIPEYSGVLEWDNNNYVLCWAVFKDNVFVRFTTENHYNIYMGTAEGVYTVRAANEMGGLSAPSNAVQFNHSGISNPKDKSEIVSQRFFTPEGREIASPQLYRGVVIVRSVYANGEILSEKVINVGQKRD